MARVSPRPRGPRRQRTATESLLSVTLVLEVFVVFFATIVIRGLGVLPDAVAIGGGVLLMLVLALASGVVRFTWGVALGFALQAVLIALGVLDPLMYLVGLGFAALYTYCYVKGEQLERAKRSAASDPSDPTPSPQGDDS